MRLDDLVAVKEFSVWIVLLAFGFCGMMYCLSQTSLWGLAYSYPLAASCWMPVLSGIIKRHLDYKRNTAVECAIRADRARMKGLLPNREDASSSGRDFNDASFGNVNIETLYSNSEKLKAKAQAIAR